LKVPFLAWAQNKFVRDAATLQIAGVLNQSSQLVSAMALAFLLGAHGQGTFISAIALQALGFFLINVGVPQATASQISAAAARGNEFKTCGWIAFLAKTMLVFGVGFLVLGFCAFPRLGEWLYDDRQIGIWASWLCVQPLIELPRIVVGVSFQGTRRMLPLAQLENAQELVRFFLVIMGAMLTGSPAGAVLGSLLAGFFGSAIALALYHRARHDGGYALPGLGEIRRHMLDINIRQGIRQGLRVALLKNGQSLFGNVFPRLIIGVIAGQTWVTYFHLAHRIMGVPQMLAHGVSRTMLPALGELAGKKDMLAFRRLFKRVTLVTGGLISCAVLVSLPLIQPVVGALFPPDYAAPVFHYAWILAIGYVPFWFAVAIESFYIVSNQIKSWLVLTAIGAAITIPANVWLILNIPETGTAWGLSLYQSWVLVHLAYITYFFHSTKSQESLWGADKDAQKPLLEEGVS
jgi:O-antigen/teichoic acid export membrane protein